VPASVLEHNHNRKLTSLKKKMAQMSSVKNKQKREALLQQANALLADMTEAPAKKGKKKIKDERLEAGLAVSCTQWRHGSARTCSLHCTLTPAACAARSARSVPGQDTRSGQGALARRHTDGPLWAALLKTTVMCEAWRRRTIAPPDPSRTDDRPNPILLITGSSIPIPVPGQYRLSLCLK
jgi:hypothetical protein